MTARLDALAIGQRFHLGETRAEVAGPGPRGGILILRHARRGPKTTEWSGRVRVELEPGR